MFRLLTKILKAVPGEEEPVLLLYGKGFFMGIFLYSYRIVSEALFISRLGEEYLAEAMFVSAVMGVISATAFSTLQNRISFSKLTVINLIIIFIFLGSIRFLFDYLDGSLVNILIFISFVMIQPIISVTLLSFWGIFGRIFDLRQSKRIIGGIDSGQLLAALLTSFSIPFFNAYIKEIDFLLVSLGGILICLFILLTIIKKYNLEQHRGEAGQQRVSTKITSILKNRYVVFLSLFLLLSMVSYQFVHYSFFSVTEIYYPSESQLMSFLGYFHAATMIISLVIQTFVNERLIAMYGLRTTLLVLPVVLGVFTLVSIVAGSFFGYTGGGASFLWFFLFIALSKLFNESLKESLEQPSFKLFFMPLDIKIRFDIQAKVEGVVNEFSRLIAGALILLLGFLTFFKLIHYSYLLAVVIIIWIYVTNRLYLEYRINVKKKLQGHKEDHEIKQKNQLLLKSRVDRLIESEMPSQVVFSLKLLEKSDLNLYRAYINKLMTTRDKEIRRFVLDKMNEQKTNYVPSNNRKLSLDKKNSGLNVSQWFDKIGSGKGIDHSELIRLIRSENPEDRRYVAGLLASKTTDENLSMLLELMEDFEPHVKNMAIKSAAIAKRKETYPLLIENLKSPKFGDKAANTLIEIGEEAFPALEAGFYKSGQDIRVMLRILQVYGKVGGQKAMDLLWNKIDFPDKKIVAQVLLSLGECGFEADPSQTARIKYVIESDIGAIAWNLKALESIPKEEPTIHLHNALAYDNVQSLNHIFMLLSMIYDSHSIQLVKENVFGPTGEGLTYAIELLDVFLSDDLKERVIFLLNDVLESGELNKLESYYPHSEMEFDETIRQIINRDYNQINRWTKSCAIYFLGKQRMTGYELDLIANLFNPDPILRETSAWSLYQINPDQYNLHTNRLPALTRQDLDQMILPRERFIDSMQRSSLRFDKIRFLSRVSMFRSIPEFTLSNIVELCEDRFLMQDDVIELTRDNLQYFYIVYKGRANLVRDDEIIKLLEPMDVIGEIVNEQATFQIKAVENSLLIRIEKEKFYDFLSNDTEFSLFVLENIYQKGAQTAETARMEDSQAR